MKEKILSVGIDIGTSTTQVIFSRFTIENTSGEYMVPRIEITNKEIVYESSIYITPLCDERTIDEKAVHDIIVDEYKKSGFKPEDIDTGAVIITGETARKENARSVLHFMSGMAAPCLLSAMLLWPTSISAAVLPILLFSKRTDLLIPGALI